jgi:hypothetical protein
VDRKKSSSPAETTEREAYEAPRIVYREPLEAVATACTSQFAKGNPAACNIGPISS